MGAKVWYTSKVLWFNIITGVLMFLALPEFISVIPPSWLPILALVSAFGNMVLRLFFTVGPVVATEVKAEVINAKIPSSVKSGLGG